MLLNTNFNSEYKQYVFCYMDTNNKLSEITTQELAITPFESKSRRFYLYSNSFHNKIFYFNVTTTGLNALGFDCKISVNKAKEDFVFNQDSVLINNNNLPLFDNAIPLDILLTSKNNNGLSSNLNIKIEILDKVIEV